MPDMEPKPVIQAHVATAVMGHEGICHHELWQPSEPTTEVAFTCRYVTLKSHWGSGWPISQMCVFGAKRTHLARHLTN